MNHHPHNPSESTNLSWEAEQRRKAKKFDELQVDTLDTAVHDIAEIKKELAVFKGKLAVVMVLGSTIVSIVIHMLTQYLGLHR